MVVDWIWWGKAEEEAGLGAKLEWLIWVGQQLTQSQE